jgi:hypothetical protein
MAKICDNCKNPYEGYGNRLPNDTRIICETCLNNEIMGFHEKLVEGASIEVPKILLTRHLKK